MNALPPHLQHLQHLQGEELKVAVQQEYFGQAVAFIIRQTDYDETTAVERLNELKDPVKVVKAYLGAVQHDVDSVAFKSKNQMKYGEIRKFMDAGARQYNLKKEMRAKYQEHLEKQQQLQQLPQPKEQEPKEQEQEQEPKEQEQEQSKGS